jgi:hypothetical protein
MIIVGEVGPRQGRTAGQLGERRIRPVWFGLLPVRAPVNRRDA